MTLKMVWIGATSVLSLSVLCFLLGTTIFFKPGIGLGMIIYYIFMWTPALIISAASWVLLKRGWEPSGQMLVVGLVLLTAFFSFFLFREARISGWMREDIKRDWVQITSDGKYEYRVEVVNLHRFYNRVKLHLVDLSTNEAVSIPLLKRKGEFARISGEGNRHPSPQTSFELSEATSSELLHTEKSHIYILTTTVFEIPTVEIHQGRNIVVFEVNMESKTSVELSVETHYRSMSEHISSQYTFYTVLIDKFKDGNKVGAEVRLCINEHEAKKRHSFSLPIDDDLLENDALYRQWGSLLVTMEHTDTPGQFIVQTTEELSGDVTLSFLIDIELGVIG